jgi:hypothetical protein
VAGHASIAAAGLAPLCQASREPLLRSGDVAAERAAGQPPARHRDSIR